MDGWKKIFDLPGRQPRTQCPLTPASPGWTNVNARQTVIKTKDGKVPSSGRKGRNQIMHGILKLAILPDFVANIVSK